MMGLTPTQAVCLSAIREYVAHNGVSPTLQELADALGLAGRSGVHRVLRGLVERGHVRIVPGKARGIELVEQRAAA